MSTLDKNRQISQINDIDSQIKEVRKQYEAGTSNTVYRNLLAIKLLRLHEKKLTLLRPEDAVDSVERS